MDGSYFPCRDKNATPSLERAFDGVRIESVQKGVGATPSAYRMGIGSAVWECCLRYFYIALFHESSHTIPFASMAIF
jgi:hypothetical protein